MRRAELLDLAGVTTASFNALAARSLLPFPGSASRRGWGHYDVEDAVRLALLRELTRAGQPQALAAGVVRDQFTALLDYANSSRNPKRPPFLFGLAVLSRPVAGAEAGQAAHIAIATEAGRVDRALERAVQAEGGRIADVQQLCFVNVTQTMRDIRGRWSRGLSATHQQLADLTELLRAGR